MNQIESARFEPRFTVTDPIAAALGRIDRARRVLDAAALSEEWLRATRARALLLEAHHTARLEGTRLTLEHAEEILGGRAVPEVDPNAARTLLNYRGAFEFASGHLQSGGLVSESLIRGIHTRLVDGVCGHEAAPAEYRRVDGYVVDAATRQVLYAPPSPDDLPVLLPSLATGVNGEPDPHPVIAAAIAEFQIAHVRPFPHGNGPTSRLVAMLLLSRAGYDFRRVLTISRYYDRNRAAYHRARQGVRDAGMDLTCWLGFFTEGLAAQ